MPSTMTGSWYGEPPLCATVYDLVAAVQDGATGDAEAVCVLAHLVATRVIRVDREDLRLFGSAAARSAATLRGAHPPQYRFADGPARWPIAGNRGDGREA